MTNDTKISKQEIRQGCALAFLAIFALIGMMTTFIIAFNEIYNYLHH